MAILYFQIRTLTVSSKQTRGRDATVTASECVRVDAL